VPHKIDRYVGPEHPDFLSWLGTFEALFSGDELESYGVHTIPMKLVDA
jgi:hypothetical protein